MRILKKVILKPLVRLPTLTTEQRQEGGVHYGRRSERWVQSRHHKEQSFLQAMLDSNKYFKGSIQLEGNFGSFGKELSAPWPSPNHANHCMGFKKMYLKSYTELYMQ